ncbi:MAG: glycosyltransferase [Phycisphaerales bacterium]|nr:glycosyltransferase [Phycisphaerales bacterium]
MRILMLGWEFPPFIAGGLGTAVDGLTKSLVAQGHEVVFVLPQPIPAGHQSHVELIGPRVLAQRAEALRAKRGQPGFYPSHAATSTKTTTTTRTIRTPGTKPTIEEQVERFQASMPSSYPGVDAHDVLRRVVKMVGGQDPLETTVEEESVDTVTEMIGALRTSSADQLADAMDSILESLGEMGTGSSGYGADLFRDADRYAALVAGLGMTERFDVIHAHDWLTYPAGMMLKALTGKPLVCHIHATEFDRSGEHINQGVYELERAGMHAADRVIAVSRLTKAIVHSKYGVDDAKIDVVYNGVDQDNMQPMRGAAIERGEKIVLFLGRITMQKGPEYFIDAAKRVLEKTDNVKFVVAGSGDMAVRMIEHAAAAGIGHKVLFTGFLRGRDVDRVYQLADCYVMPSVSEPFGIAPLEAMRNDVPVIVSKQSGVAEVLTHALKVDFWDIDEMANKIVAVLKYPPLGQTLREHGRFELRGLHWDGAAEKCVKVYAKAIAGM